MPVDDEIQDEYANAMRDGDFVIEHREGSNMSKFMTPEQMETLARVKRQAAIDARAKSGQSIFHRIRD